MYICAKIYKDVNIISANCISADFNLTYGCNL